MSVVLSAGDMSFYRGTHGVLKHLRQPPECLSARHPWKGVEVVVVVESRMWILSLAPTGQKKKVAVLILFSSLLPFPRCFDVKNKNARTMQVQGMGRGAFCCSKIKCVFKGSEDPRLRCLAQNGGPPSGYSRNGKNCLFANDGTIYGRPAHVLFFSWKGCY